MDAGQFAGIFATRPTEWITMSSPGAGNQIFYNYMYMYMYMYTITQKYIVHVYMYTCTHYAAIHVTCVLVGMRLYMSTGPVASLKLLL